MASLPGTLKGFFVSKSKRLEMAKAAEALEVQRREMRYEESVVAGLMRKEYNYIEARSGIPIVKLNDYASFMTAGTGRVWATARSLHLVGSVVSSARLFVQNIKSNAELDSMKEPARFLVAPNPYDSMEEMTYWLSCHIKLTGNGYWLKDEADGRGRPKAIYPMLPQFMKIVPDRHTKINRYEYHVNGTVIVIPPEQIIHFKRPGPSSLLFGQGDVEGGQELYQSYINRSTMEEQFIANGAQPSGILTRKDPTESITPEQWDALKAKFKNEYTGRANAGKVCFLNGDWTYLRMGLTLNEMEALEKERLNIEQIFLNHGVPLSVAGIKNAANYATAKIDDIAFRKNECVPLLRLICGKLNSPGGLAMPYDPSLRFQFELSGLIDVEQTVKDYGPLVDRGAMTLNELRVKAGLPKSEDVLLDQYFVNNNRIPLELAGMSAGGPEEPQTPPRNVEEDPDKEDDKEDKE
jgi:HK97 family phage portal protein